MHYDIRFWMTLNLPRQPCPRKDNNLCDAGIFQTFFDNFLADTAGWAGYYDLHGMATQQGSEWFL